MTLYYQPVVRGILAFWLLFVCFSLMYSLLRVGQQKRYGMLAIVALLFAGCDVYWQYLNANSYFVGRYEPHYAIDLWPVWLIVFMNALLSVAALWLNIHILQWQKSHISAVSVKESFDTLPSCVCFFDESGRIYLVNEAMDRFSQALTGKHLYNGEQFFEALKQADNHYQSEDFVIFSFKDRVYSFTRYTDYIGKQRMFELIGADITKEFKQKKELEQKNRQLKEQTRLLDEYNRTLAEVIREREIMQGKSKVHDNMNILLLSTVKNIENYNESEAQELLEKWQSNTLALEKESIQYPENPLDSLESWAGTLGITMVFSGEFPTQRENARLLVTTVSECMTNALRHAGAAALYVSSNDSGALITNDGEAPVGEIKEGGGFGNLRKRAEKIGAKIEIQSIPRFSLQITYKKEE